jgi:hypothetical protein
MYIENEVVINNETVGGRDQGKVATLTSDQDFESTYNTLINNQVQTLLK